MEGIEEKLGAILGDPQTMQKLMAMAQSLSGPAQEPKKETASAAPVLPDIDPGILQGLIGLSRQSSIDKNQQALLSALRPYLSQVRIRKLENAMRAAKMAGFAAMALSRNIPDPHAGR